MSEKTRFYILITLLVIGVGFIIFTQSTIGENFVDQL